MDTSQPLQDNFNNIEARYVKLTVTGAHNYDGGWVSINEFIMTETVLSTTDYDYNNSQLNIYPNPSKSGLFNMSKEREWSVYNTLGVKLNNGKGNKIDLSNYARGTYFLKSLNQTKIIIYK